MGRNFNGSTDWLSRGTALLANVPISIAGFFNPTVINADGIVVGLGDATATNNPVYHMYHNTGQHWVEAEASGDVDDETAHTSTFIAQLVTWHVCATFGSTSSRKIYLNGNLEGSSTVTVNTTNTMTDTRIGNMCLNISGFTLNGIISTAAVWGAELAASEASALAAGFSPKLIRASALKGYCRMLGGFNPEPDFCGGSWALVGAPTFTDVMNTRLYNP